MVSEWQGLKLLAAAPWTVYGVSRFSEGGGTPARSLFDLSVHSSLLLRVITCPHPPSQPHESAPGQTQSAQARWSQAAVHCGLSHPTPTLRSPQRSLRHVAVATSDTARVPLPARTPRGAHCPHVAPNGVRPAWCPARAWCLMTSLGPKGA